MAVMAPVVVCVGGQLEQVGSGHLPTQIEAVPESSAGHPDGIPLHPPPVRCSDVVADALRGIGGPEGTPGVFLA